MGAGLFAFGGTGFGAGDGGCCGVGMQAEHVAIDDHEPSCIVEGRDARRVRDAMDRCTGP
jgi:hypothetical protein